MDAKVYSCGDCQVDLANRRFTRQQREVTLEPRVLAVIARLLARAGSLVTRDELLDAVWGHRYVTPSALNRTIALARKAFGDDPDQPRYIQTVHGAGYRYIGAVADATEPEARQLVRFEPPASARIPAPVDSLVGRDAQLAVLGSMLEAHRAVTVLGAGGMGKTRFALESARLHGDRFPDGVWFFDLVPHQDMAELEAAVASVFAARVGVADALLGRLGTLLRDRRLLVVFDNCERLAARLGTLVVGLLRATRELRVLATSQLPLAFAGEQLLRLPPLECPHADRIANLSPDELSAYPAIELMIRRVRSVRPEFDARLPALRDIAAICTHLDGMPLALELAAARFSLLSSSQILQRLEQRFRLLSGEIAGRDPRHQNLRTLLEWSFSLLSAAEGHLLQWLAVFVQSWTVDAAVDIGTALGHDAESSIDLLTGLVNHSLVTVAADATPPRYRLLESVREYALLGLREAGEEWQARDAHRRAMENSCGRARAAIYTGDMRRQFESLIEERGDIGLALEAGLRSDAGRDSALGMLGSLLLFVKGHGDYVRGSNWCRMVLSQCDDIRSPNKARALLTCGVLQAHLAVADAVQATVLPEAIELAVAVADDWTEAYACGYQALFLANRHRVSEAARFVERCEAVANARQDDLLRGLACLGLGWIRMASGDLDGAVAALEPARELGPDLHQRHFVSMYVGLAHFGLRQWAAAAQDWMDAMVYATTVANVRGLAGSVEGCAYIACDQGEYEAAAELLSAARVVRERTGMPIFTLWLGHQAVALDSLRAALDPEVLRAASDRGALLRTEDAVNRARSMLARYARNSPVGS